MHILSRTPSVCYTVACIKKTIPLQKNTSTLLIPPLFFFVRLIMFHFPFIITINVTECDMKLITFQCTKINHIAKEINRIVSSGDIPINNTLTPPPPPICSSHLHQFRTFLLLTFLYVAY